MSYGASGKRLSMEKLCSRREVSMADVILDIVTSAAIETGVAGL